MVFLPITFANLRIWGYN